MTTLDVTTSSNRSEAADRLALWTRMLCVLFFFSGLHGDYHKPSDTWDKIDAPAAVQVLKMVAGMAGRLEEEKDRPVFVRVEEKDNPHAGSISASGSSSGGGCLRLAPSGLT